MSEAMMNRIRTILSSQMQRNEDRRLSDWTNVSIFVSFAAFLYIFFFDDDIWFVDCGIENWITKAPGILSRPNIHSNSVGVCVQFAQTKSTWIQTCVFDSVKTDNNLGPSAIRWLKHNNLVPIVADRNCRIGAALTVTAITYMFAWRNFKKYIGMQDDGLEEEHMDTTAIGWVAKENEEHRTDTCSSSVIVSEALLRKWPTELVRRCRLVRL